MLTTPTGPFLQLHPDDNVLIARESVAAGIELPDGPPDGGNAAREPIPMGHKLACRPIAAGEPIRKFGQIIGFASQPIAIGNWVHAHNVGLGSLSLGHELATEIPPDPEPITGRTFAGYRRADGKAGTRNYLGIISTVNCSATASKHVAAAIGPELLADYPQIDGVVPLVHKGGCAMSFGGPDHRQLARTLAGFARHPNIGAYLVIGLGCETAQASFLVDEFGLVQLGEFGDSAPQGPPVMNIQDEGGIARTVDRALGTLRELLPEANAARREPIPVSEIMLGTECGGSDGNSGVTANPAVGIASDLLVAHGGTSILSETPEMYGAEHLLTRRAASERIGQKLLDRIRWWEDYAARHDCEIDNNPSVGNKAGGLTTIYEKSLGAIAKGGSTALREVYEYAEPVTERGFVIMDTPGFDPASVTGMIAGGANVVVFTTGRGSCFGCKPVPTIKIATNSPMYHRMESDMDFNAGTVLEGGSVEEAGREIFEMIIRVASGEKTKSERQNVGDEEFCPWVPGPIF